MAAGGVVDPSRSSPSAHRGSGRGNSRALSIPATSKRTNGRVDTQTLRRERHSVADRASPVIATGRRRHTATACRTGYISGMVPSSPGWRGTEPAFLLRHASSSARSYRARHIPVVGPRRATLPALEEANRRPLRSRTTHDGSGDAVASNSDDRLGPRSSAIHAASRSAFGADSWSRAIIPPMNGEKAKDGGFERRLTGAWRSIRRHLPPRVAEAIRVPAKRLLRRLHVI